MTRHLIATFVALVAIASHAADPVTPSLDAAKAVAASHAKKGADLRARGRLERAEREFALAIASYPQGERLYSDRAEVRYLRKNYRGAIEDFDVYLAKLPNDARALFLRGLAKSLLKPEDVSGACADIFAAMSLGASLDGINGLDKYCSGQPNWSGNQESA